ncbi:MAG: ATP-binding protein [Candidatus Aminicenantaceae bacterium]
MKKSHFVLQLAAGGVLVLVSIYGFLQLNGTWLPQDALALVDRSLGAEKGQVRLDGGKVEERIELEYYLCRRISGKQVGDRVLLEFSGEGGESSRSVPLISYFEAVRFPHIHLIVMGLSTLIGFVVFVMKKEDVRARLLYWGILTFAAAEVITGGFHCLDMTWMSYIPAVFFYICYALAPTLLLHFSLTFSPDSPRAWIGWIYAAAFLFIMVLESLFLYSSFTRSIADYRLYLFILYFFWIYVFACLLAAVLHLILIYRRSPLEEVRARIKWFLYGLFLGLGPFVLLYLLPKILTLTELVSMEVAMAFSPLALVGAAIAIIRYRLLDIEIVINRSLVYSFLTILVVGIYLFLVRFLQGMFSHLFEITDTAVSALAAFGAALIFHPARKKIQEFVDRSFFRIAYDYQKCIQTFAERASQEIDAHRLVDAMIQQVESVLPVSRIGVLLQIVREDEQNLFLVRGEREKLLGVISESKDGGGLPHGRENSLSFHEQIDFSQDGVLKEHGWELLFPISFTLPMLSGFLALGPKRSGQRFGRNDVALLQTLTQELGVNLERIRLQEEVVYERAEKEKLDELNKLKTEFISAVSHELRTPMSTLSSLADVLQEERIKDKNKRGRLLRLMSEECTRLSQFLHNILDSGRIERDVMSYSMEEADLNYVVQETVNLFEQRLRKDGFECRLDVPPHPVLLNLDQNAVRQALTNLIDNAIKYSKGQPEIHIVLEEKEQWVALSIEDRGIGIPSQEQQNIFEGFFRGKAAILENPGGVGIGLKLVKHILEAHGGRVRVESELDLGSKFILEFLRP